MRQSIHANVFVASRAGVTRLGSELPHCVTKKKLIKKIKINNEKKYKITPTGNVAKSVKINKKVGSCPSRVGNKCGSIRKGISHEKSTHLT
jgi:hypothetical protein